MTPAGAAGTPGRDYRVAREAADDVAGRMAALADDFDAYAETAARIKGSRRFAAMAEVWRDCAEEIRTTLRGAR